MRLQHVQRKLCSIQKLYDDTGIQTLQKRRNNHKLFQLYKILNGLTPQYLQSLIPQRVQNISRYQLRNMNNFNVPPARTVTHANSFLPSTLRDWNSLDLIVRNSPTLNSFKRQLNQTRNENPYPKYFDMSNFNGHLLFQADRLSCSYLNPPGGTNFTLPVLILSLSGRRSNHSYGRFIH